jgi:hypothetical protein
MPVNNVNRIPTPGVKPAAVRQSSASITPPKPKKYTYEDANRMLMKSDPANGLDNNRRAIQKKTGWWPNGYTN